MKRAGAYLAVVAAALMAGCASLPSQEGRTASHAITDTAGTRLGRALADDIAQHPGKNGVHSLADARDAYAARALLANGAEKSIDAQYYIWHGDQSGELLLETLWEAAKRGVRVRLLVDDSGTGGLDESFAAFQTNPNFQVRLYNAFASRSNKYGAFVTDFTRVNRRMHNKQFTVDNQASIIGGRNIGNEYFQLGGGLGFADADVVVFGPIVQQISDSFDLYWNSASAYPAERLIAPAQPDSVAKLEDGFAKARADPDSIKYVEVLRTTPLVADIEAHRFAIEWTTMQFVCDDPAKTLDKTGSKDILLYPKLVLAFQDGKQSFDIVSPYFVPSKEGVDRLTAIARRGIDVRLLTNALAASDEAIVHAGYKKHREELASAGVHIWELKPTALTTRPKKEHIGSSTSALHAKVYAVDRSRIFVGSYNFDQRSANLNTEQGLIIDSAALAGKLATGLDQSLPAIAYEVVIKPGTHDLQWIDHAATPEARYDTDPGTSWWLRAKVSFFSILPIDWLL
jgi:putative cardiolipin synthase